MDTEGNSVVNGPAGGCPHIAAHGEFAVPERGCGAGVRDGHDRGVALMPFCLLVVATAPGRTTQRLTTPATPRQAAAIASAALLDTLATVCATPGAVPVVALTAELRRAADRDLLEAALDPLTVIQQCGTTFADRLANAYTDAAGHCPGLPIVQIGTATPQVTPSLLTSTATSLDRHDIVLGPADSGGWWALGLRDPRHADALRGVPMSRGDTAARAVAMFLRNGSTVDVVEILSDVDTMPDAIAVAGRLPGSRFADAVADVTARLVS